MGEAAPPGSDGETEVPQFEEPEADVVALSEESRQLLGTTIVFLGVAGLYLLWSPVLPALRVLDDVTLWHRTATVDGEARNLPITDWEIEEAVGGRSPGSSSCRYGVRPGCW